MVFSMVPKRLDQPTQSVRPFVEEIKQLADVPVFDTIIRQSTALFAAAPRDGVPVSVKTSVPPEVAKELDDLATEFIAKSGVKGPNGDNPS